MTDEILDVLADRSVVATWFLQGRWVEAFPAVARRVASDGHLIGNHSFYHARLPLLTDDGIATDVREAERVIAEIIGVEPRPWFRSPFSAGSDDERVLAILARLGYRDIDQDVVLGDWEPDRSVSSIAADALREAPMAGDPAVILFHAWPPGTLDALPVLIDGLRAIGADFVRIDELERYAAPAEGTAPGGRRGVDAKGVGEP